MLHKQRQQRADTSKVLKDLRMVVSWTAGINFLGISSIVESCAEMRRCDERNACRRDVALLSCLVDVTPLVHV